MAKHIATIVLTDDGTDEVKVSATFQVAGDPDAGATDDSAAHRTAMSMLADAVKGGEK